MTTHSKPHFLTNSSTLRAYHAVFKTPSDYGKGTDSTALEFHSDQGATDLIALLSISAAKEGGESLLVSTIAIHNELLRRGRKVGWAVASQCCALPATEVLSVVRLSALSDTTGLVRCQKLNTTSLRPP